MRKVERILSERNLTLSVIIAGGAKGADTLAERYAKDKNLALEVHKPIWKHKGAGKEHNKRIVENADFNDCLLEPRFQRHSAHDFAVAYNANCRKRACQGIRHDEDA